MNGNDEAAEAEASRWETLAEAGGVAFDEAEASFRTPDGELHDTAEGACAHLGLTLG